MDNKNGMPAFGGILFVLNHNEVHSVLLNMLKKTVSAPA